MRSLAIPLFSVLVGIACGGRSVEQIEGTTNTNNTSNANADDRSTDPGPGDTSVDGKGELCSSGYDVEYVGPLVKAVSGSAAVALAPQGIYVLSQERGQPMATLRLYDADGSLLETTPLHTACGRLYDLEWQDGELFFLGAECDWTMSSTAQLLRMTAHGDLVHGPTLGDEVVAIASGNDGELFVLKFDGIGRLSLEESGHPEIAVDPELPSPPGWGPTSGFAHVDGHFMFSRDAFEGGMTNQIMIVSDDNDDRSCKANVELFLPGEPGIKIAADSERLMLLGTDLESFTWSPR